VELFLKYLSQISVCGAAVSFIFGLIKWLDQRNREREDKEYQYFHKMVCLASGSDEAGGRIKLPQQVAAIYQLQRYKQYSFASVPVLELLLVDFKDNEHLKKAITETIAKLS
jgi:hypothetical protein